MYCTGRWCTVKEGNCHYKISVRHFERRLHPIKGAVIGYTAGYSILLRRAGENTVKSIEGRYIRYGSFFQLWIIQCHAGQDTVQHCYLHIQRDKTSKSVYVMRFYGKDC